MHGWERDNNQMIKATHKVLDINKNELEYIAQKSRRQFES